MTEVVSPKQTNYEMMMKHLPKKLRTTHIVRIGKKSNRN